MSTNKLLWCMPAFVIGIHSPSAMEIIDEWPSSIENFQKVETEQRRAKSHDKFYQPFKKQMVNGKVVGGRSLDAIHASWLAPLGNNEQLKDNIIYKYVAKKLDNVTELFLSSLQTFDEKTKKSRKDYSMKNAIYTKHNAINELRFVMHAKSWNIHKCVGPHISNRVCEILLDDYWKLRQRQTKGKDYEATLIHLQPQTMSKLFAEEINHVMTQMKDGYYFKDKKKRRGKSVDAEFNPSFVDTVYKSIKYGRYKKNAAVHIHDK